MQASALVAPLLLLSLFQSSIIASQSIPSPTFHARTQTIAPLPPPPDSTPSGSKTTGLNTYRFIVQTATTSCSCFPTIRCHSITEHSIQRTQLPQHLCSPHRLLLPRICSNKLLRFSLTYSENPIARTHHRTTPPNTAAATEAIATSLLLRLNNINDTSSQRQPIPLPRPTPPLHHAHNPETASPTLAPCPEPTQMPVIEQFKAFIRHGRAAKDQFEVSPESPRRTRPMPGTSSTAEGRGGGKLDRATAPPPATRRRFLEDDCAGAFARPAASPR